MKEDIVLYPAVFSEDGNRTLIRVPDLQDSHVQGANVAEAVTMVESMIGKRLDNEKTYPEPSSPKDIQLQEGESLVYITVNMARFRIKNSRTVKKNLTIPEYLNIMALERNINVSQVLTEALRTKFEV